MNIPIRRALLYGMLLWLLFFLAPQAAALAQQDMLSEATSLFRSPSGKTTLQLIKRLRSGAAHGEFSFATLYPLSHMEEHHRQHVVLPSAPSCKEPAYTKLYFTGSGPSAAVENGIMMLVCGYQEGRPATRVWADKNNNLDFSDDGGPLRFSGGEPPSVEITLSNAQHPKAQTVYRLSEFAPELKKKMAGAVKQMSDGSLIDFYREDRRNILAGDYVVGSDSFRVGLMDWDVDGLYNETGEDRLLTGPYGSGKLATRTAEGAVELASLPTHFQGPERAYQVTDMARSGTSITLAPALSAQVPGRLREGEQAPKATLKMLRGKKKRLSDFIGQSKYLYLNFWATWCAGCHKEVDQLKALAKSPKVTVLSLNYNEDLPTVASFIDEYEIKWPNGFSNAEINRAFMVEGLPRGVLIGPGGQVVNLSASPDKVLSKVK